MYESLFNNIGGVMIGVLASSAVDHGFEPRSCQPKTIKLVFVFSPLWWCLHFIASNYTVFEKRSEFHQLKGDNKKHIGEHRWPALSYLEEDSKYKAEMKKRGEKCSVM